MCIDLEFYDIKKLLEFKKWLNKNKLVYDYINEEKEYILDEYTIRVFDLSEYNNNYRSVMFNLAFCNENGKYCYTDLKENEIARWKISLS